MAKPNASWSPERKGAASNDGRYEGDVGRTAAAGGNRLSADPLRC